ncbi:MAG: flavodoxin family protein [Candidatus Lokiarchaeota archaeon]|nr:flavodoxin family protein [Candidatus Lokiarchaeota archaeon]
MKNKKALFIMGSPRKNGNTKLLTDKFAELLEDNFEIEKIFLSEHDISPCKECYHCIDKDECSIEDDMQELYGKLKESQVIILSSPIFMGGISATLRAFMERTWHLRKGQLAGKIGSYILVGRRDLGAGINEMEEYLSRLQLNKVAGVFGFGFHKGDVLKDEEALKNIQRISKQIISLNQI